MKPIDEVCMQVRGALSSVVLTFAQVDALLIQTTNDMRWELTYHLGARAL